MVEKAESLVRDNTFLEFRLDYLPKPPLALCPRSSVSWNTTPTSRPSPPAAARPAAESSRAPWPRSWTFWPRPRPPDANWWISNCRVPLKCKPEQLQRLRAASALILSYHDFRATKKLEQTLEKMLKFPADFYKIVDHRHHAFRQRDHDEVPGEAQRPPFSGRAVHGGTRHHQPGAGGARRKRFHLRRGQSPKRKPLPARSRPRSCAAPIASSRWTPPRASTASPAIRSRIRSRRPS